MELPKPMMPNFEGGPIVFLKEVRTELSKVIWPTRTEVIKLTAIVVIVSTAIGLYVGGLDVTLAKLTELLINR